MSDFHLGFRGCYYCGDQREFRNCPRRNEPRALQRMRFNMQCHQVKVYFGLDRSRTNQFGKQPGSYTRRVYRIEDDTDNQDKRHRDNNYGRGAGINTPAWMKKDDALGGSTGHHGHNGQTGHHGHTGQSGQHGHYGTQHGQHVQNGQHG